MSRARGIEFRLGGKAVSLAAAAKEGKAFFAVAVGPHVAADRLSPAAADRMAKRLRDMAARIEAEARTARKQARPGLLRRLFRRKRG